MPVANQAVRFIGCTIESYKSLGTYNENTLYFTTDTKQIFLGSKEFTKSVQILESQPNTSTIGEEGKLYVYNGNLYVCKIDGYSYTWTRVANVNDKEGTVTKVTAGSGLDGGDITESGTISHAVPSGASAKSDDINDTQSPGFGSEFEILGVTTDEFGHVTEMKVHRVVLPNETSLNIQSSSDSPEDLNSEDTFTIVTDVAKGTDSHDIQVTTKTFKLPAEIDTTYVITRGATDGTIKVTPSSGEAYEVAVEGWDQVAKLSDISAVFTYKGAVGTYSELPPDARTGDVYTVQDEGTQYVYAEDSGWEKFGSTVDLSPYALKEDYIPRVTSAEGEVPKFDSNGTLSSTGFTLEKSVPADAKFTDTVYEHDKFTPHEQGLYKIQVDDQGHVSNATSVVKQDIVDLGIPEENTDKNVRTTPDSSNKIYITGTTQDVDTTGELKIKSEVYIESDGSISATAFHGKADSASTADSAEEATKATCDSEGNNIKDTYATKSEVQASTTVWEII